MSTVLRPPFLPALAESRPELRETHISWVLLGNTDVIKIKKPVCFPFLDFSTLSQRKQACEAEVALNRRLSPDVYLGVWPITLDAAGQPNLGGAGEPVEYAVRMRRLPDVDRADLMFEEGRLNVEKLEWLAEHVARFHAACRIEVHPDAPGGFAALKEHVEENLSALGERGSAVLGDHRWRALCERQRADLQSLEPLFERRRESGRVRDGHGDLRLDHVYFSDSGTIRVLDCVEFDPAFRVADVCADIAYFAMNLYERGRVDWAERFVARYARDAGDHDLYALLDFYLTYWALVRAKVSEARAGQTEPDEAATMHAASACLLELAHGVPHARKERARLCLVGGIIGAGKSRLAVRVGAHLRAPVLQSDRLRKQLLGVSPHARLRVPGAYSEEATRELYAELRRRARLVLQTGRPVVVDASFRSRAERAAWADLAEELGVPFLCIECSAPRRVLEARLRARERRNVISDARLDLLESFIARYEPLDVTELSHGLRVDTSRAPDEVWDAVRFRLRAPAGRTTPRVAP